MTAKLLRLLRAIDRRNHPLLWVGLDFLGKADVLPAYVMFKPLPIDVVNHVVGINEHTNIERMRRIFVRIIVAILDLLIGVLIPGL